MKKFNLRMNFFWDDGDDMRKFRLTVPDNIEIEEVKEILIKTHEYLDIEDETDLYGTTGRTPVTLLDYICKKYGWSWEDFSFDIDLNFD